MTDITIGIPYYEGTITEELSAAIESILKQTIEIDEVHLIRDGPVSKEIELLEAEYLKKYDNIKLLIVAERQGLAYALNVSILQAKSTFYARMDADDLSHPERLEKQLLYLKSNPHIDILGTWALEFTSDIEDPTNRIRKMPVKQHEIYRLFHYRNPLNHPTIIFRRNIFARIGLYNSSFTKAQDTELYARAFKNKVGVANLPAVLYYLRLNDTLSKRTTKEHIKYQLLGRYKYNTWSIRLNILKVASILFRFLPKGTQQKIYENYKW